MSRVEKVIVIFSDEFILFVYVLLTLSFGDIISLSLF